ncbi:MAG: MATE family efflux transporter, partial [Oscillospiraceae bacterium]
MTSGKSIAKQLILFVIPIWLGSFFQQLYNAADAMFVGRFVGKAALAAVGGPTSQIVNLLVGVFVELAAGSSVIIAQYFGAQNEKKAGRAIHTAMAVALICGVIITAAGLIFSPLLLRSMDVEGDVYEMANAYLRIYFSGTLFITIYNMGSSALRALGDSKRPFYYLVTGCLTNIALDYILIRWANWGVVGAAVATVFSEGLSTVLIIRALCRLPNEHRLYFRKITIHKDTLIRMLSIGVPEGMQQVLYSISNILIQTNIDGFGTDAIAGMSAYSKVDAFFWLTLE